MLSSKDLLLADLTHAERLRQVEDGRRAHQAVVGDRRLAGGRWWVRGWRRRSLLPGTHVADLAAATRA